MAGGCRSFGGGGNGAVTRERGKDVRNQTELHTLHDDALRRLKWAFREEDSSGSAIVSMNRAYWEGYRDALAEAIRIAGGKV